MTPVAVALACAWGLLAAVGVKAVSGVAGPALSTCARDDIYVNDCLKRAIQAAVRTLAGGYAPFGMGPLDPTGVPSLTLDSPEGAKCNLSYTVYGISKAVVDQAIFSNKAKDKFRLTFAWRVPQFDSVGTYKMEQNFLGSTKANEGTYSMNATDYRIDFAIEGVVSAAKDGQQYASIQGIASSINGWNNAKVHFENLGDDLNRQWNEQPDALMRAYKKAVDPFHPSVVSSYANSLFQNVPFNQLFPATKQAA